MKLQNKAKQSAPGIPAPPAIVGEIMALNLDEQDSQRLTQDLVNKYPQYFQRLLNTINTNVFDMSAKAADVNQAMNILGFSRFFQLAIIQLIYQSCNQYKIKSLDMRGFWQDALCRAVSAKKIATLTGLDADRCFTAGFVQDIGFLMMFFEDPMKSLLWSEFRKRDPAARLSMEENIFKKKHPEKTIVFLEKWGVLSELIFPITHHHTEGDVLVTNNQTQETLKIAKVLQCADWITSVYSADNKSHVINQCRKMLLNEFAIQAGETELILESIPEEIVKTAEVLNFKVEDKVEYSKILHQANIRLNEDNDNYQDLTLRLDQALTERDRLANEINRELNLAREIQQSLLPKDRGERYPVHGINLSAKALSGDFYDYFEIDNGDIYFNLGDVSGKGVNAALLMAKTCSLFRCLGKRISDPAQLMFEVNNELCETAIHGMFVTMVAGLYRPSSGEIKLVNAGNPPALLFLANGLCQEFAATAPPLGVLSQMQYSVYTLNLNQGSLYIYSDGVTEGYNDENEMLELGGLFKLISSLGKSQAPAERLQTIVSQFTETKQVLRDDVTLLLLENNHA